MICGSPLLTFYTWNYWNALLLHQPSQASLGCRYFTLKSHIVHHFKTPHNGIRQIFCPAVPSKMVLSFPNGVTGWALNSFLQSALSEVIGFAVSPPNKVWIMTYRWLLHLLISPCIYKLTEKASVISQSQCDGVYLLIAGGCHDSACHLNDTDRFGGY